MACLLFYAIYFQEEDDLEQFWYFLGGGMLAGVIVGVLMCKFQKVGAAMLAGWGGFTAGLLLTEVAIAYT